MEAINTTKNITNKKKEIDVGIEEKTDGVIEHPRKIMTTENNAFIRKQTEKTSVNKVNYVIKKSIKNNS